MAYKDADVDESLAGKNDVRSGTPFYSPSPGEGGKWRRNRVRILPPRADQTDGKFYQWVATHGDVADRPILCNEKMFDEPCPVCTKARELQRQGRKDDAGRLFPSWKALVNVIVMSLEGEAVAETDGTIRIRVWPISRTLMDELLDKGIPTLPNDERDITHVKAGRDLVVRRKGTGMKDTRYEWLKDANEDDKIMFPAPSALPKAVLALIRDEDDALHALNVVYPHLPTAKIVGLLEGPKSEDPFEDEDDDDDDDEAVEGTFRTLPKDEDDADAKPAKAAAKSKAATDRVTSAREELQRRINNEAVAPPDDEDDDEDDN